MSTSMYVLAAISPPYCTHMHRRHQSMTMLYSLYLAEFIHPKWINMPEINIAITELNLSTCDVYKGFDD